MPLGERTMAKLSLKPVKMTPPTMRRLEHMGLIRLLSPQCRGPIPEAGTTRVERLYTGDPRFGPHCLIAVTVGAENFRYFGSHSDNEDIFFIGSGDCKPLYLAIAFLDRATMESKVRDNCLSTADFICLEVEFNNPETSFFVMNKNVVHGECAGVASPGNWPSFYVTEPGELDLSVPDLGQFELCIDS